MLLLANGLATPLAQRARASSRAAARPVAVGRVAARGSVRREASLRVVAQAKSSKADSAEFEVPEILTETAQKIGTAWEETEDKPAVVTLLAFGFVGLWAVAGVLKGIEALPLAGTFFELVGITFSGWFVYRYLLFKPDREELKRTISELKTKILQ